MRRGERGGGLCGIEKGKGIEEGRIYGLATRWGNTRKREGGRGVCREGSKNLNCRHKEKIPTVYCPLPSSY